MKRTPAALFITLLLASAGNPAHADLTATAILTRMTDVYAHVRAYSDHGTVSRDESWPWILWHLARYGRASDEFRTSFVRGRTIRFTYSPVGGHETAVTTTEDLAAVSGLTHGVSTAVPLLLSGDSNAAIRRLTALKRLADGKIGNKRCFVITGTLHGGGVHASYTLYIDQQTYFLRRITREIATRGANTIDYAITAR